MNELSYINDYVRRNAETFADKPAVVVDGVSHSWSELWQEVKAVSQRLRGLLPGDKQQLVAILMPNSWDYVVAHYAILEAGHIVMPVDVIYKPLEINAILDQMKPALIIADEHNASRLKIRSITLAKIKTKPVSEAAALRLPADEQIATIFFTSGTTGRPKAVPNTHANHLWNIEVCSRVWEWTSDDSLLISVRLHHMLGSVMGLSGVAYHGNTFYLTDRFDAEEILKLLSSGRVTMFSHAPLVYAKLLESKTDYDLSPVRLFISGSGPLPPAVWRAFKNRFGKEILEVYGSSETGRIASNLLSERIPGSPGRPLPGVEIKIDSVGELSVKSSGVFPGYYKNDSLTRKHKTPDGFWKTGDIAEIKDGRIVLKGRTQEVIRRQGYTVSPRDIEWALQTNPSIKDVAVVGMQGEGGQDDKLVYFVVSQLSEEQIRDFCGQQLPSVWRADVIKHLDQIPKNERSKVDITKLRSLL